MAKQDRPACPCALLRASTGAARVAVHPPLDWTPAQPLRLIILTLTLPLASFEACHILFFSQAWDWKSDLLCTLKKSPDLSEPQLLPL